MHSMTKNENFSSAFGKTLLLVILAFRIPSQASDKGDGLLQQFKGAGQYGMAGCGLGSMIFGDKGNQVIALTSNHLTSTQTFGISTGTLNCDPQATVTQKMELPQFIEVNHQALARDAARGDGETLNTLAEILPCDGGRLKAMLKDNYKQIFIKSKDQPAAIEATLNMKISETGICSVTR